eukprot:scaffold142392_cov19-Tisochrysis_lutea.AAC.3
MYPAIPKQTSSRSTAQNEVMHRIAGQTSFRHRIPTRPLIKHVSISVEASQHPAKSTQNWGINLAARASWQRFPLLHISLWVPPASTLPQCPLQNLTCCMVRRPKSNLSPGAQAI